MESLGSGGDSRDLTEQSLVTRRRQLQAISRRAVLDAFGPPRAVWTPPEGPSFVGWGTAATLSAEGNERLTTLQASADRLFSRIDADDAPAATRPRLVGGMSFHDAHEPAPPWTGFDSARFVLPELQLTWTDDTAWLTANAVAPDDPATVDDRVENALAEIEGVTPTGGIAEPPGVASRERCPSRERWREQVRAAIDRIRGGDLQKVVLAQSLSVELERQLSLPDVIARLDVSYPDCQRFLVQPGDGPVFFGATPERLVSAAGRTVETVALAGSTGRGDTTEEDEWLAAELLDSEKDIHEHELVADAVRTQLSPYASSVQTGQRTVRKLPTVQHLQTPITAELDDAEHVLTLVKALHPTPAVGGLPPDAAWETIRETEAFDRGWYASPVGWFDAAGDGAFAVGIRSAVAEGDRATLFAGAGIVADSDPDREWDEVQLKYGPMLDALE
ncbi:isochorismate synthase [Natranaeroarchaeum sulfidigenes]|uniref:isochorismate synthase n=1 Tax=Natranaeroarchaeum sulfidigenes TaxID=2784880 RepID=A0A897MVG4_9EURY|nr:isochorismate synthase [Natranaeroarchaeum sulfidigenes]QSG02255.1 Menaquinone-specific isochorismate synthase [Natranaeroarchaeum sulfidigenes]